MDALASLPRELVFDKKPKIAVKTWRTDDPRLQGLRGRPAWDRRWEQLK